MTQPAETAHPEVVAIEQPTPAHPQTPAHPAKKGTLWYPGNWGWTFRGVGLTVVAAVVSSLIAGGGFIGGRFVESKRDAAKDVEKGKTQTVVQKGNDAELNVALGEKEDAKKSLEAAEKRVKQLEEALRKAGIEVPPVGQEKTPDDGKDKPVKDKSEDGKDKPVKDKSEDGKDKSVKDKPTEKDKVENPDTVIERAKDSFKKKPSEVIKELTELLKRTDLTPRQKQKAYLYRGKAYAETGQREKADADFIDSAK